MLCDSPFREVSDCAVFASQRKKCITEGQPNLMATSTRHSPEVNVCLKGRVQETDGQRKRHGTLSTWGLGFLPGAVTNSLRLGPNKKVWAVLLGCRRM